MPYNNLSFAITPAQKAAIKAAADAIRTNLPFLINLSLDERKTLRKIGSKRIGYVKDVLDGSKANPSSIPSAVNMTEFDKDVQGYADMSEVAALLRPLFEAIEDTTVAVGSEATRTADQCYKNLKANAKGNASVKNTVSKIGLGLKQTKTVSK